MKAGGGSIKALIEALQTGQAQRDVVTARLEHVEGLEKASEGEIELDDAALDALAALQDEAREHPPNASLGRHPDGPLLPAAGGHRRDSHH